MLSSQKQSSWITLRGLFKGHKCKVIILCKLHSASREFQEWMHRLRCLVPSPSSSRSIQFGHSFAWATWPETLWPRGIMRSEDSVAENLRCSHGTICFSAFYKIKLENFVAFFFRFWDGWKVKGDLAAEWKRIKGGQEPEEALNNLPAIYYIIKRL